MTIGCDSSTPLTSRFDAQVLTPNSAIFNTLFEPSLFITNNPLDRVDRTTIVDLTNRLNILLGGIDLTPYPVLKNRFDQFPITYVETADFVLANQINTSTIYPVIRDYNPGISMPVQFDSFLSDFDFHLDANIGATISGGLCGQFGNIFNKLLGIFTLIDTAKGLIDDIKNLSELDPLKKAKSLSLQQILVALKKSIVKVVKKLVKKVKKQIEAMVASAVATITDIKVSAQRLYTKLKKMADDISEFFEDASIESFLDRIEKFIANTSAQFERLTIENVALLMFRFCQFTELLQALLMGPAKALTALAETIAVESLIAKNASLKETKAAVEAGATRVPQEVRLSTKSSAIENINSKSESATDTFSLENVVNSGADVTSAVTGTVTSPVQTQVPDTTVTTRSVTNRVENPEQFDWQTPREATSDELNEISSITEKGIAGRFKFKDDIKDNRRWQRIEPIVWAKLIRVCEESGKFFLVTSAFRSKEYNRSKAVNGASNSIHMSGYAIDIRVNNAADRESVFLAAQRAGFTGIGIYSTFMHLDCGSRRMWVAGHGSQAGSSYPVTGPEKQKWINAIPLHMADVYRKNSGIPAEQLAQQNSLEKQTAVLANAATQAEKNRTA